MHLTLHENHTDLYSYIVFMIHLQCRIDVMLVWSLGQEDPLEKEMATQSKILAWKILWTEEPGRLQSMGSQKVRPDWVTCTHTNTAGTVHQGCANSYILHGHGNIWCCIIKLTVSTRGIKPILFMMNGQMR